MMSLLWHHSHNLKTFRKFFFFFFLKSFAFAQCLWASIGSCSRRIGAEFSLCKLKFSLPSTQDCVWQCFFFFCLLRFDSIRFAALKCLLFLFTLVGFLQTHLHFSSPHHPSKALAIYSLIPSPAT